MKRSQQFEQHEFADKVEARERLRKRRLFLVGVCAWLALASVPAFLELRPKWKARFLARRLAEKVSELRRFAMSRRATFKLSIETEPPFLLKFDQVTDCSEKKGTTIFEGALLTDRDGQKFQHMILLDETSQARLQLEGLKTSLCFSALKGSDAAEGLAGFAFLAKEDLVVKRLDRMSVVLIEGPEAQAQFD